MSLGPQDWYDPGPGPDDVAMPSLPGTSWHADTDETSEKYPGDRRRRGSTETPDPANLRRTASARPE